MTHNNVDPFQLFGEMSFPAVTVQRTAKQLGTPELNMDPSENPDFPDALSGKLNNLDWVISVAEDLVKLECILPTTLSYEDVAQVLQVITNEHNASAFDGRARLGQTEEGMIELRGDASFVTTAGMNDDQLFHALNLAIIAAQDALFSSLDRFNAFALAVKEADEQGGN
ncbi:TPA: hypothetical protein JAJ60_000800 [Corynebacterium striatum]|uniref:hypothetical protein n=1 Tax=Corynebacterium striatum TaxID=43770 RepID=UPI001A2884C2|nr:hypothetical protein [Corynebacterium striatum]HAT1167677.1 hypothetical protein [Corynebacterium striatum]HAT1172862.1 hypothetical protein [Corynebacterium striatum]HAT1198135.1 hypothetical protein [Corynebacterium striatum]HAT1200939.1 hypothetical protein [Corynebacterium striatum]